MRWFGLFVALWLGLGGLWWWSAREASSVEALEQSQPDAALEAGPSESLRPSGEEVDGIDALPSGDRQVLSAPIDLDGAWQPWQPDPAVEPAMVQRGQVVVQVLDPEGFAVPAYPVELKERSAPGAESVETRVLVSGRTNERGWLAFDLAGLQAKALLGTVWEAEAGLAWQRDSRVRIDRERADEQVWELEIPTGGVVRVELQQLDGTPYDEEAYVAILWDEWRRNAVLGDDGAYWMHDLPLGTDLTVQVWPDDEWPKQWVPKCRLSARIPCVSRVVRVGETATVIHGRLLDPSGSPLVDRAFWLRENEQDSKTQHRTDASGRFELAVHESLPERLEVSVGAHQIAEYRGHLALPDLQSGEHRDLGDVTLEAQPCLVAGVLQRPDGKPTGLVTVRVARLDAEGKRVSVGSAPSSAQGQFFVPGNPPGGSVQVWIGGDSWARVFGNQDSPSAEVNYQPFCLPEPTWVSAGQRGLVLHLVEAVKIHWDLPDPLPKGFRARFVYESGRVEDLRPRRIGLHDALAPGRAHWEFFAGEDPVPFWTTPVADWSSDSAVALEAVRTELLERLAALTPTGK